MNNIILMWSNDYILKSCITQQYYFDAAFPSFFAFSVLKITFNYNTFNRLKINQVNFTPAFYEEISLAELFLAAS